MQDRPDLLDTVLPTLLQLKQRTALWAQSVLPAEQGAPEPPQMFLCPITQVRPVWLRACCPEVCKFDSSNIHKEETIWEGLGYSLHHTIMQPCPTKWLSYPMKGQTSALL